MKTLKVLAVIGCLLTIWGLVWGIFIKDFIWGAFGGLMLIMPYLVWGDEEE